MSRILSKEELDALKRECYDHFFHPAPSPDDEDEDYKHVINEIVDYLAPLLSGRVEGLLGNKIRGSIAYALGYSPEHKGEMCVPAKQKPAWNSDQERAELQMVGGIVLRILNEAALSAKKPTDAGGQ